MKKSDEDVVVNRQKSRFLKTFVISVYMVLICLAVSAQAKKWSNRPYTVSVQKVVDGDSLLVADGNSAVSVRLWGIDAPEYDQPYSSLGKNYLQRSIGGERVRITPIDVDKYGRLIALIDYKGENINEQMVRKGYAWVHIYFCHREICLYWRKLQIEAQRTKKGLWRAESPVPPWKWKRRK